MGRTYKYEGNYYLLIGFAIGKSKGYENVKLIIYCPYDDANTIFVRDEDEFFEKFEYINGK